MPRMLKRYLPNLLTYFPYPTNSSHFRINF